jgi:hypothetical protein
MPASLPRAALLAAALLLLAGAPARADDAPASGKGAPAGSAAAARERLLAVVDELRAEASAIRGLAWKTRVEAELQSREELQKSLEKMIKEDLDPADYEREVKALRRLGLIAKDEDPIELTKRFLGQGVAGYFDPKTKRLYLIDGLSVDAQRPTILHELVHALEDQYVDIEKTQDAIKKDGDKVFALKCVLEGSAEEARSLYEARHPEYARLSAEEQRKSENTAALRTTMFSTPVVLFLPTMLHYQSGPAFVGRATNGDYAGGMARLYRDLPVTQEQVLHPGKYVGDHRDLPRACAWPSDLAAAAGEGWKGLESFPVGELDLTLWLDRWLGGGQGRLDKGLMEQGRYWSAEAQKAAQGWDAGWMQLLEEKGEPRAVLFASAWDTTADAHEAALALEKTLRRQHEGRLEAGAWVTKDGTSRLDFAGPQGAGAIVERGDEVRLVDGVPASARDHVVAALEGARFTRDPKDTWTKENAPDPLAGTAWRHERSGLGWRAPPGEWAVVPGTDPSHATLRRGGLEVHLTVREATVRDVVLGLVGGIRQKYAGVDLERSLSETRVAGGDAVRVAFDTGDGDAAEHHDALVVSFEGTCLVVFLKAPKGVWDKSSTEFETCLRCFVRREADEAPAEPGTASPSRPTTGG